MQAETVIFDEYAYEEYPELERCPECETVVVERWFAGEDHYLHSIVECMGCGYMETDL